MGCHPRNGSCANRRITVSLGLPSQPHRRHDWSGIDHPTRQHRPLQLNALPGHLQTELVKLAEGRQISEAEADAEGRVLHVEVFRMSV